MKLVFAALALGFFALAMQVDIPDASNHTGNVHANAQLAGN